MNDPLTRFLAVYAALVSTAALVWTVVSWLMNWVLTGARVKAEIRAGATNGAQYLTIPIKRDGRFVVPTASGPGANSLSTPMLFVEVRNVGRFAATVEGISLKSRTGEAYGNIGGPDKGPAFPLVLDAGRSATLAYDWSGIDAFCAAVKHKQEVDQAVLTVECALGNGKKARAKPKIRQ